jgi:CBS domain containing-hemolysin-like protein
MFVQFIVLLFALIAAASKSLIFEPGNMTTFELQRRAKLGDSKAQINLRLRLHRKLILVLQRYVEILAFFMIVVLLVATQSFVSAVFFVLMWLFVIEGLASLGWYGKLVNRGLRGHFPVLLNIIEPLSFLQVLIGREDVPSNKLFYSKAELLHFIEIDKTVLDKKDKQLIGLALNRQEVVIKDVMTPRSKAITIDIRETVGPLLLDRIHKTGKMHMLVTDKDIDNPVGVLSVPSLMPLDPQTRQAGDMQLGRIFYVNQDQPIDHALNAFLQTGAYMFIVVNTSEEITGVISIEDILQTAIGDIADSFDQYEDRQVVARLAAPQA